MTAKKAASVGERLTANDNDPVYTLTRSELGALIRAAVSDATGSAERLVDKQSLAALLGCSANHVDNLRQHGMPWVPVGKSVRFEPSRVVAWLRVQPGATGPEETPDAS